MKIISKEIHDIIKSQKFKEYLEKINVNYSNLKQEGVIRNAILEIYNEEYSNEQYRAFAEHPRIEKPKEIDKRKSSYRVDLSIVNKDTLTTPYKIELKYHFPKHRKDFSDYRQSIVSEFRERKSNMFILVVADWNLEDKKEFDDEWDIKTNLSKYLTEENKWEQNLQKCFNEIVSELNDYKSDLMEIVKIEIKEPYLTKYHFYILKKK